MKTSALIRSVRRRTPQFASSHDVDHQTRAKGLAFGLAKVLMVVVLLAAGCRRGAEETPYVGHTSYQLGRISLQETNASVQAEFMMPQAAHVYLCLVLDGVQVEDPVQMAEALRLLEGIRIHLELYDEPGQEPVLDTTLGKADLGQFANWYAPDAAFVLNPPLRSFGDGAVVRRGPAGKATMSQALQPGKKYRLSLRVVEAAALTNRATIRLDQWGTIANGRR